MPQEDLTDWFQDSRSILVETHEGPAACKWCLTNLRSDDYICIASPGEYWFQFFSASAWVEFCLIFPQQ
jgi:hypothetical protein